MRTATEFLRLAFRICLSCTLMIEAAVALLPHLDTSHVPTVVATVETQFYQAAALGLLYFLTSIWLLFGIHTRVVAAIGGILLVLPAIIFNPLGNEDLALKLTLAAVFAVPLVMFGGGRYSVYEGDWRKAF